MADEQLVCKNILFHDLHRHTMKSTLLTLTTFLLLWSAPLQAESLYKIDFSTAPEGDATHWLHMSNFALQQDAKTLLHPVIDKGKLLLRLNSNLLGGLALRRDIPGAKRIKVIWGVNQYPKGANWDQGIKRESAMFIVVFGKDLQKSDAMILPNVPYFFGAFLGEKEKPNLWRKGTYYHEGGSYICLPCGSEPGKLTTTELELPENFRHQFNKSMPEVIGFGFEFDTRNTEGNSEVMIQSVEFFDN